MKAVDDKIRQKIEKLYALAKRGVGGEAKNAEVFFQKMIDKYGLSVEDFEFDSRYKCRFLL